MSLNIDMEKKIKESQGLKRTLVNESLTKKERDVINSVKKMISEAPIDYEGPERMDPNIENTITKKETPFHGNPAVPKENRDFLEVVSSKRFKDSVEKVRRYLGDTTILQGRNPVNDLMQMAMGGLQKIMSIESRHKEYLEKLAVELVKKELGIPKGSLQFDAKLIHGGMSAAEGMREKPEEPDEEEIEDAFKNAEENPDKLKDFADEFEKFNLEKAKRRFINSLIQGAAFKGGHMYVLMSDKINQLNPELMNLYGVTQSLMEHLYWIYPDMESMASSGGGQMGQSEIDDETDPPTVIARAGTFPLLVHELVKGVYEVFGTHGLPDDPKQSEIVQGAEDTLPAEIWDSRLGPIFWEKLQDAYPDELFEEETKFIQHYLFVRFSKISAKDFLKLANSILKGDNAGKQAIQRMVNEIIADLKKQDLEQALGSSNDDNDDDVDDVDLSSLGL